MNRSHFITLALPATMFIAGCATVDTHEAMTNVTQMVHDRAGVETRWRQDTAADSQVDDALAKLLEEPLTSEAAVEIALLRSPELQATYEELGVAQANLVEAGLLKNPVLAAQVRWPTAGSGTNAEMSLAADFLDLLMIGPRKRMAEAQWRMAQAHVADVVLDHVAAVREAYYELVAAQQRRKMRDAIAGAADLSLELMTRLHGAGNVSDLDLSRQQDARTTAHLTAAQRASQVTQARARLQELMGLDATQTQWTTADQLAAPDTTADAAALFAMAHDHRLDRQAAADEVTMLADALGVQKDWGWLSSMSVGPNAEHDLDGTWVVGPHVEVTLPIFDQGQPETARVVARLRQSQRKLEAIDRRIESQITTALDQLRLAHAAAQQYRDVLIPLRTSIVSETQRRYNFMLSGIFEVIAAREAEYEAYESSIEAMRDYWIAHAQLERAVGWPVTVESDATPPTKAQDESDAAAHEHHHDKEH
ncbi:MAG: hypothetical protein GC162_07950 [Planctomycetes bacterium]|nr:hypothetical protein [Planctomycetota bacterium]